MSRLVLHEPTLDIERDEHGVPNIAAAHDTAMYRGMGYCHAVDRGMQMLMMRLLGRGQLSKLLGSSDARLQVDLFSVVWAGRMEIRRRPRASIRQRARCSTRTAPASTRASIASGRGSSRWPVTCTLRGASRTASSSRACSATSRSRSRRAMSSASSSS
jgi:hypothetical protein